MTFSLKGNQVHLGDCWLGAVQHRPASVRRGFAWFTTTFSHRMIFYKPEAAERHRLALRNTAHETQRQAIDRLVVTNDHAEPAVEPVFSALRAEELISVPRGDLQLLLAEAKGSRRSVRNPALFARITALLGD